MRVPLRLPFRVWLVVPLLALGFLAWSHAARIRHVEHVTSLAGGDGIAIDAASPTGYAGGVRRLIVPDHASESMPWIMQTQQMLVRGEWRVRHIDGDNAPNGRAVRTPSPYRWWLGAVAWVDAAASGRPPAASVERAALLADPLLQGLLLIAVVILVARWCGAGAAAVATVALTMTFPFGASFLPGQPGAHALALACAIGSVLPIVAALRGAAGELSGSARSGRFALAGVAGGFGLWIDVGVQAPLLAGVALGGVFQAWFGRRVASPPCGDSGAALVAWRVWAIAGAVTSLLGWLVEYAPAHLSLDPALLEESHPLYAVAWLGLGELVARVGDGMRRGREAWRGRTIAATVIATLVLFALPAVMVMGGHRGFLAGDAAALRLSDLPDGAAVGNLVEWVARDGLSLRVVATIVPVLLACGAAIVVLRRRGGHAVATARASVAFALGPMLVALGFACFRLREWSVLDGALVALAVSLVAARNHAREDQRGAWAMAIGVAIAAIPGCIVLFPDLRAEMERGVTRSEVQRLIERDLAIWLASQAPESGATVLAPPELTTSLMFHGGLRGLGSPDRGNEDGFRVSVRIAAATSADEAHALIENRGVRAIIVPSWDGFLDEYARLGTNQPESALIAMLHQWLPPRWLRPVPYQMPTVEGFEGQSVVVFEVVEVQENSIALSRMAEYFLETGRLDQAARLAAVFKQSFPSDPAALVARAQVAAVRRDAAEFREVIQALLPMLEDGSAETLTWDRRVSLALMLAHARRMDLARAQVQRCLDEMDEPALRSLTNFSLHRLHGLNKALGLEIPDPELRALALRLLPPEYRPAR